MHGFGDFFGIKILFYRYGKNENMVKGTRKHYSRNNWLLAA